MSETSTSKRTATEPRETAGILASLPNTRPQRPSSRRKHASPQATAAAQANPMPARAAGASAKPKSRRKPAAKATSTAKPKSAAKGSGRPAKQDPAPAPRQGFEVGSEVEQGLPVGPPSSVEFAASIVGLLGEAAQAGVSSGGRLLKGAFARLQGH